MAASTAVEWEDTPRRDPPSARAAQVATLTGLRGFAALMVVLIHVGGRSEFPWVGLPGYGPVSLFVLSGYLLFRPWSRWGAMLGERPSVRVFARRRLMRIFPAYLVVLVVVVVVYPPARPDGADGWLRAATLTGIYASDGLRPGLEQTWSLGTELSWYVALPVVGAITAFVARRVPGRRGFWFSTGLILLALPVSAMWRWWVEAEELGIYFTYSFWLPGFAFCFAAGALVAHLGEWQRAGVVSLRGLDRISRDPWILVAFAVAVALVGTSSLGGPDGYVPGTFAERQTRTACAAMIAVTLLVAAVRGGARAPLNRMLGSRVLSAIGRWSYGIYLWHLPVVVILEDELVFPNGLGGLVWRLVVVLTISVPLGAATYAWVEKPTIAWSRKSGLLPAGWRGRERQSGTVLEDEGRRAAEPDSASRSVTNQPDAQAATTSGRPSPAE